MNENTDYANEIVGRPILNLERNIMKDLKSNLNSYYYNFTQSYWYFSFGYFTCHELSSFENPNPWDIF